MVTTKLGRSRLLNSLFGLITLCLPAVAQPGDHSYTFGAIPLSKEEYQRYLKTTPSRELQGLEATLPTAYNAADLGFVTPAKAQGLCGACWAFTLVGAMESKLLMSGVRPVGSPLDLSEQQQVSCNTQQFGCRGGYMTAALFWSPPPNPNFGPLPESVFPYSASNAPCHNPAGSQINVRVIDYYTLPVSIAEYKNSLYKDGPGLLVYVIFEDFVTFWESAPLNSVYKYKEGFIEGIHAVLLIGWDDEKQAFLLKNSWGEKTGPNGNGTFWMSYGGMEVLDVEMSNFRIRVEDPPPPTPIPSTADWALALISLSLLLISLQSLRRRV